MRHNQRRDFHADRHFDMERNSVGVTAEMTSRRRGGIAARGILMVRGAGRHSAVFVGIGMREGTRNHHSGSEKPENAQIPAS